MCSKVERKNANLRGEFVLKMHFENVLKRVLVLLWIYSTCYTGVSAEIQLGDPYRILGVERKASAQEIRQAYKKLVKKWYARNLSLIQLYCYIQNLYRYLQFVYECELDIG